jgi:hypothetical protein
MVRGSPRTVRGANTPIGGAASLEPRTAGTANSNSGRSLLRRSPQDQRLELVLEA